MRVRTLALAVVAAAMLVAPLGGIAAAGQGNGGGRGNGKTEVLATLKVENPQVEVKKKGADDFEPATDGQQLRQGDTVRTDATGRAEIDYSEDSYTRLDVNTTFKIVKLTEQQGERQVEGGLESGRTWNRAEAVTESGSFEQSGGGATAAVTGTAFPVECSSSTEECIFTGVVGTYILKGTGEEKTIEPFDQCDSISGELCDEVTVLTVEEMAAIAWIQENLLRDLLERGYGPGPFVVGGTLVIQDGVITFEETPPPPPAPTTTTTTLPKPALKSPPIECEVELFEGTAPCDYAGPGAAALEPTSEIIVYEGDFVLFKARVETNGASGPVFIVFDEIPGDTGHFCLEEDFGEGCDPELETDVRYDASALFVFSAGNCDPFDGCQSGVLKFHLENDAVGVGDSAEIPITVEYLDICSSDDVVGACGQAQTTVSDGPGVTTSTSTSPTTTSTTVPASDSTTTSTTSGAPDQE
jgi:hypothetical protein